MNSVKGVVLGDIHHAQLDEYKMRATHDLLTRLVPEQIITHDVLDAE